MQELDATGKWEGLKETVAQLRMLETKVANAAGRKALRAGAKVEQEHLVAAAPAQSGMTRRAIRLKAGKRKRNRINVLVQLSRSSFANMFYAGFVNYGWIWSKGKRARGKSSKRGTVRIKHVDAGERIIPGTHWMETATAAAKSQAEAIIKETLDTEIKAALKSKSVTEGD